MLLVPLIKVSIKSRQEEISSTVSWLSVQSRLYSSPQSLRSSDVSRLLSQYRYHRFVQPLRFSAVSWLSLQSRYSSSGQALTSSAVRRLLSQYRYSSSGKMLTSSAVSWLSLQFKELSASQ